MDIYRGYDIKPHANGGFYWTDERGFDHTGNFGDLATPISQRVGCYPTVDEAMADIDAYKRNMRSAGGAA